MAAPGRVEAGSGSAPPLSGAWRVVLLLWFCGFFNYADRQAVFSVFPLIGAEFELSKSAKGAIGSAFMIVYATMAPFAGYLVDRFSRRWLIAAGLGVWSLVCAATALSQRFWHLLAFRAAEGLGESFYFPASMSLLADYHGPRTRSRAMSTHQTSVYAGTAVGGVLAGFLGERYDWRMPFYVLGALGILYALILPWLIREPRRGAAEGESALPANDAAADGASGTLLGNLQEIARIPAAVALLAAFAGANFVAMTLLAWLPDFVYEKFHLDLTRSAAVAGLFMPGANLLGAVLGGMLADRVAWRPGGRIRVQAAGLLLGAPCVLLVGLAGSLPLLIVALVGMGLCKGVYDANIFASVYDVVRPGIRGTAAGFMNTVGWIGGSLAPILVGTTADRLGLSQAIAWTALVYVLAGVLAVLASRLVPRRPEPSAHVAE
jgi:MFS family permease